MNAPIEENLEPVKCVGMEKVVIAPDLTIEHVHQARERIGPYIHNTPILTSTYLNEQIGAELFFKCENFQKAGAFKVRGACNSVFGLTDEDAVYGVATHSSGT